MAAVKFPEFVRHLQKGEKIHPLYLFHGEERFLTMEGIQRLRDRVLNASTADFNLDIFFAEESGVSRLLDTAMIYPVLAPMRLVVVHGVEAWKKQEMEKLFPYFRKPSPTTCMVLTLGKAEARKNPLLSEVDRQGMAVSCAPLYENELGGWVRSLVKRSGKEIASDAVSYLAASIGSDLFRLQKEIDKVVDFTGDRQTIDLGDVEQLSTGNRAVSTFDFVQTLGEKNSREALRLLGKILEGAQPLEVLGVILWNFRLLCRALEWVDQGFSSSEAVIKAKIPPFAAKKLIKQMDRFRSSEMPRLFDLFLEADLEIKGDGSLSPSRVLEKLVWQVCGVR